VPPSHRLTLITALLIAALTGCGTVYAAPVTEPAPAPLVTVFPTATTIPPTETPPPTVTPIPAPTELPGSITDDTGAEMLLIPAGDFIQGSETGFPDEVPVRTVTLDAFYIDRLEVSNARYRACVEEGTCAAPRRLDCCTEMPGAYVHYPDYFYNSDFDDYPVVFITWYDARDFCAWRGVRLLTEAEWEKASRGPDGRTYPWGNEAANPDLLNFSWYPGEFPIRPRWTTAPVGTYPAGASPYGVLDLAGNVYEWVQDIYAADYYAWGPTVNPTGPSEADGTFRVTRGGSFWNKADRNRSANRNNAYIPAESFHFDGGARCGMDADG
jgi:formylglycine-generating enzyme required for sulfatase activity